MRVKQGVTWVRSKVKDVKLSGDSPMSRGFFPTVFPSVCPHFLRRVLSHDLATRRLSVGVIPLPSVPQMSLFFFSINNSFARPPSGFYFIRSNYFPASTGVSGSALPPLAPHRPTNSTRPRYKSLITKTRLFSHPSTSPSDHFF